MNRQTCDDCERPQRFEYSVSDEIWETVAKPEENLCIECFCKRLDLSPNKPRDIAIADFVFLGIVLDNVSYVIVDRVPLWGELDERK